MFFSDLSSLYLLGLVAAEHVVPVDWSSITKTFKSSFDRDCNGKSVYIDSVSEMDTALEGNAKFENVTEKWHRVLILDAVMCFYRDRNIRSSSRRKFNQHRVFRCIVEAEVKEAVSKSCSDMSASPELVNIESPWQTFEDFSSLLSTFKLRLSDVSRRKVEDVFSALCVDSHRGYIELSSILDHVVKRLWLESASYRPRPMSASSYCPMHIASHVEPITNAAEPAPSPIPVAFQKQAMVEESGGEVFESRPSTREEKSDELSFERRLSILEERLNTIEEFVHQLAYNCTNYG